MHISIYDRGGQLSLVMKKFSLKSDFQLSLEKKEKKESILYWESVIQVSWCDPWDRMLKGLFSAVAGCFVTLGRVFF